MKKLIILPGNSTKNKAWGDSMAAYYGKLFDEVYVQNYDHWVSGEETINFDTEAKKLREVVSVDAEKTPEYTIFAKSYGSVLALQAIHKGFITPKQCIFFGIPLNLVEEHDLFGGNWSFLSSFTTIPAIAFHNTHDPIALYDFTAAKLAELKPSIHLLAQEGDNHSYDAPASYEELIKEFIEV